MFSPTLQYISKNEQNIFESHGQIFTNFGAINVSLRAEETTGAKQRRLLNCLLMLSALTEFQDGGHQ